MWPLHRARPQHHDGPDPSQSLDGVQVPGSRAGEPIAIDDERIAELLDDLARLRLFVATDMSIAAGAADAGAYEIAGDVIDAGRDELSTFEARILARMHDEHLVGAGAPVEPAVPDQHRPRSRRLMRVLLVSPALPAVPVLAATAAAAAVALGAIHVPGTGPSAPAPAAASGSHAATASWDYFHEIATSDPSASAVIAAGQRLHASLVSLIDAAQDDPAKAQQALDLLAQERALLLRDLPPGAQIVLAQADNLVLQLQQRLPRLPQVLALPSSSPKPSDTQMRSTTAQRTSAQPAPAPSSAQPTASTSPSPSPSTSASPTPSASPKPSPDTSPDWGPLRPPSNFGN